MFARSGDEADREDEIETRGILASGNYTAVRGMSEDLISGGIDITGSELVNWT